MIIDDSADLCDEIQSLTAVSYKLLSSDPSSDILTLEGSNLALQTGDRVAFTGSGLPAPIVGGTNYYVISYQRNETPRIKVATTLANAIAGTAINITTAGNASNKSIVKNGEPRYHGGGVIKTSTEIGRNLTEIMSGMGGRCIFAGGKYIILAGKYYPPTYYFDEHDVVSNISVTTKKSKENRFNRIKGIFTSPVNNGNPTDYPLVKNALYESEDGEIIERDLTLPFTQRSSTAQRIAKMELERQRQEIIFSASFNLKAFKVMAGDNIYFSFKKYGWANKVFEVLEWSIGIEDSDGVPLPVVNMTLQENASQAYDWNNGEETLFDPAPNTTLPNPFYVAPVTGFTLNSFLVDTQSGDKTYKVLVTWDAHPSQFVREGGFFEVEYKRTITNIYASAGKVDGSITEMSISQLQPNITYDIAIRAFNNLRASSGYVSIYNFKAGDTATSDTEDWEFNIESRDGDDWENDTLTSENWE